jgi:hypothetical protein
MPPCLFGTGSSSPAGLCVVAPWRWDIMYTTIKVSSRIFLWHLDGQAPEAARCH